MARVNQVFLSHAKADEGAADEIGRELAARGLKVVRSVGDDTTLRARRALAESSVLVAVYSRRYPVVRTCQAELTGAILAAQRHGDVHDRVVAVNPEADDRHIVPAGLLDVRAHDFADAVAEKASGAPFGGSPDSWMSGRHAADYAELWEIHHALQTTGARETGLAEQYSLLFRDAYPGGIIWLRLAGDQRRSQLAAAVSEAAELFDLDLHGLDLAEATRILGTHLTEDVLWIVDGASDGLALPGPVIHVTPRSARAPVAGLGHPARIVLAFAASLAPVPITAELLMPGVSGTLGPRAPMLVAGALDELDELDVVHPVAGERQAWQLSSPVLETGLDHGVVDVLVNRAATVIERLLAAPVTLEVFRHALEVARHPAVPAEQRLALIRAVARGYEERGDTAAAGDTWRSIADEGHPEDVLAAARLAVETGEAHAVIRQTARLIQDARQARDVRTEHRARFVAATAHDLLGAYARADKVFHAHPLVAAQGTEPVWLGEDERRKVALARVRALRLRGEYRQARGLLDTLLPEIRRAQPYGSRRGDWPVAILEHARLLLLAGEITRSRAAAGRLIELFARAGWARHRLARAAVAVLTEGEHSTEPVRRAVAESAAWYGEEDPLTLELRILHAQTLSSDGQGSEAIAVLADAEARAAGALGAGHPLTLKARQWTAVVRMRSGDWDTATRLFGELVPCQEAVLGVGHPESRLARLELGVCLARSNQARRARPLLKEAVKALHDSYGPWQHWVSTARAAAALADLPGPFSRLFPHARERAQPGCQPMP